MASSGLVVASPPSTATWTFTQGFLLGQASFLVIALLFIRYVVFSPAEPPSDESWKKRRAERAKRAKLSTTGVPPPPPNHILQKTGYEMATHPAESSDWLNVLMGQILQGYRNDMLSDGGEEGARQRIEKMLNPGEAMSWLDPIQVTGLSLGAAYPLLSNARVRPADGQGHIRAEIDIDYLDSVSLSLSTSVLINFPAPRFAVLPVSLGVELVSIGGTLSLQIHDPAGESQHLHVCLLPDFHLNLKTTTLLGSRAKLQDVPKLEQLILSRLRGIIQDRLVYPHHLTLALPRLLSPSVSPTPIINDIAEKTVAHVSEALRRGVGNVGDAINSGVRNLMIPSDSLDSLRAVLDTPTVNVPSSSRPMSSVNGAMSEEGEEILYEETSPLGPKIVTEYVDEIDISPVRPPRIEKPASPRIGQRRITMPPGFPMAGGTRPALNGTASSASTSRPLPPYTPSQVPRDPCETQEQRSFIPRGVREMRETSSNSVSPSTSTSTHANARRPPYQAKAMSHSRVSSVMSSENRMGLSVDGSPTKIPQSSIPRSTAGSTRGYTSATPGMGAGAREYTSATASQMGDAGAKGGDVKNQNGNFRFRGQFATNPNPSTPGPGQGLPGVQDEGRKVGALNARPV